MYPYTFSPYSMGTNSAILSIPLQLYNYFEDANYVYLVLEMCQNGELNRYLKTTRKRLTEAEGWSF